MGKRSLQQLLRLTHRLLATLGLAVLGYCGFILADVYRFERRASAELEQKLQRQRAVKPAASELPPAIGPDGLIGRIEIARIGLSAIVSEGTDRATLRHAVGHILQTALPGEPGNIGIAGHRDTFFRPLRNVLPGDTITLTTLRGQYRYRVMSARVVAPTEVSVLKPGGNEVLTLVTCYPFYFVGSAPERFVVRAERVVGNNVGNRLRHESESSD